jgi:ribokinase
VIGKRMSWPPDGGKGSNQAVAAARLGASVAFVGCVGADDLGDAAVRLMVDSGVDLRYLVRSESTETGCGVNIIDASGLPVMVTVPGANAELTPAHVAAALEGYPAPAVVMTQFEIDPSVALHALRLAKASGARTVLNAAPAVTTLDDGTGGPLPVDVLVVNESEAAVLAPGSPSAADGDEFQLLARLQQSTRVGTVIMTVGDRGVFVRDGDDEIRVAPTDVAVVDTSGAGDVFCAALAVKLAQGAAVRDACVWANLAAGVSVTRVGTIPAFPSVEDVDGAQTSSAALSAKPGV